MVGRAVPLIIDIFVTALAGIGLHEELAGNFFSAIDLSGTWEERTGGPVALVIHGEWRQRRILYASALRPASIAKVVRSWRQRHQNGHNDRNSNCNMTWQPSAITQFCGGDQAGSEKT